MAVPAEADPTHTPPRTKPANKRRSIFGLKVRTAGGSFRSSGSSSLESSPELLVISPDVQSDASEKVHEGEGEGKQESSDAAAIKAQSAYRGFISRRLSRHSKPHRETTAAPPGKTSESFLKKVSFRHHHATQATPEEHTAAALLQSRIRGAQSREEIIPSRNLKKMAAYFFVGEPPNEAGAKVRLRCRSLQPLNSPAAERSMCQAQLATERSR